MNSDLKPTEILQSLDQLIIYRSINEHSLIKSLKDTISAPESLSFPGWYGLLLEKYPGSKNPWACLIWDLVKYSDNFFSLAWERSPNPNISASIFSAVNSDLRNLEAIINWEPAKGLVTSLEPSQETVSDFGFQSLNSGDIKSCLDWLANFYSTNGSGIFGLYSSFTWSASKQEFRSVISPDPFTLADLIGNEDQKQTLIQNTSQFLSVLPANNILLYGDRGTGKSSSIRALNNQFASDGLRLIEVNKEDLGDFPAIIEKLHGRGLKFILFVDDLSFETGETQYKHLKAVLEGGLEVRPSNVLIYATSNRRHLIKETMAEREEDLHGNDTVQEKLSLADRFGITLTFLSPNQEEYLAIVNGLAKQRNIRLSDGELRKRAIQWELQHNGRSGRTAKQFIDQLQGELKFKR